MQLKRYRRNLEDHALRYIDSQCHVTSQLCAESVSVIFKRAAARMTVAVRGKDPGVGGNM